MNISVSSIQTAGTVEGFKYKSKVVGIGAEGHATINIFIPSKLLEISNDGRAQRSNKADKAATKVYVPINKIDEINGLVQEKVELDASLKANSAAIKKLAKEIIIKSKNASSSEKAAGTIEGIRNKSQVYGISSDGYSKVNIFIPSKQLTISDDGNAKKSTEMDSSPEADKIMDAYFDECTETGREFDRNELEARKKKANEETSIKVEVPIEGIDEMNSLVREKEILHAKQKVIIEAISKPVKELF